MPDSFFDFFYQNRPEIDLNSPEWGIPSFKTYPRAKKIPLPSPKKLRRSIDDVLKKRKTVRNFSYHPISLEILGTLLYFSAGMLRQEDKKIKFRRPYPSGGAGYPVEVYTAVFIGDNELKEGVYHYNVQNHALEFLEFVKTEVIKNSLPYDFAKTAPGLILLSFISEKMTKKYGSLCYKLGMLEAGHVGQNICLVAEALGLGALPLGGVDYAAVENELKFGEEESGVYEIAMGYEKNS